MGANYSTYYSRGVTSRRESRGGWVLSDLTSLWPDRLVYYSTLPDAEMVCTAGWEPNTPPILGADPAEEGIKKRLGAFRPDFPVAAGQQVSLLRYALDAGMVCTAVWEPATLPTGGGPLWRNQEAAGCFQTWLPHVRQISPIRYARMQRWSVQLGGSQILRLYWGRTLRRRESRSDWVPLDLTFP